MLAYEALTGLPPFAARNPQALIAAHATETPVPITVRRPSTPAPVAATVMRCLEKRPADRPQSADEIARVLEGIGTSGDTAAETTAMSPASQRLRRWVVGLAAIVLALLILAGVLASFRSR